jgi:outer membrane protein TolC
VAFYALLADDALIASAREMRAERERVVDITHRLVQSGFRTQVDDTRAQVALDIAQLDLTSAEAARDNDSVTLASALLLDPSTTFRLQAPPPFGPAPDTAHVDVARARREVAAAAARVDQARHDVTTAHRAHLPVLAANASGSLLYVRDRSTFQGAAVVSTGPTELAQGGLVLTVPLYDPLLNANVRGAEANLGEAQASLEQVTQDARSEASRASRQVRNASLLLDQATRLGAAATATLNAVEERYASGIEGPIVLIDAQREDALARVAIVRACLALDVARVRELESASRVDELRGGK